MVKFCEGERGEQRRIEGGWRHCSQEFGPSREGQLSSHTGKNISVKFYFRDGFMALSLGTMVMDLCALRTIQKLSSLLAWAIYLGPHVTPAHRFFCCRCCNCKSSRHAHTEAAVPSNCFFAVTKMPLTKGPGQQPRGLCRWNLSPPRHPQNEIHTRAPPNMHNSKRMLHLYHVGPALFSKKNVWARLSVGRALSQGTGTHKTSVHGRSYAAGWV